MAVAGRWLVLGEGMGRLTAEYVPLRFLASISQGLGTSGQGAGARRGSWRVNVVRVGSIQDDRLVLDELDTLEIEQNARTERHLLDAGDVVVSARTTAFKAALVPPPLRATVADATSLVARAQKPSVGAYLWWFLTSTYGRQQAEARMVGSTTLRSLSVEGLGEVMVPVPGARDLYRIADFVEASERAYAAAIEAARLRRAAFREAIVDRLRGAAGKGGAEE